MLTRDCGLDSALERASVYRQKTNSLARHCCQQNGSKRFIFLSAGAMVRTVQNMEL